MTSARRGDKTFVGAFCDFKWAGKFYEGEVLVISGECGTVCILSVLDGGLILGGSLPAGSWHFFL